MRASLILLPAVLTAMPATALAQDRGDETASTAPEKEKKVCRNESRTGSLLRRERICMTAAEWNQQAEVTKTDMERFNRVQSRALRTDPRTGASIPE